MGGNFSTVYSSRYSFAALRTNGSVAMWNYDKDSTYGFDLVAEELSANVTKIYAGPYDFIARKEDGSSVCWGRNGVNCTGLSDSLRNISEVYAVEGCFAAVTDVGAVVSWGHRDGEGYCSYPADDLSDGVVSISTNVELGTFAAVKSDGSVVVWASIPSSVSTTYHDVADSLSTGVVNV